MARKPAADLTDIVMDVLRGTPQKFKEIYAKVAQRSPENCPPVSGDGRCLVKVADTQWLHQLERILEHVAVSRGVLWQLKEDIPPPPTRKPKR
jgi:hypothetical protein